MPVPGLLYAFIIAAVVSGILTKIYIVAAHRLRIVSRPNPIVRNHTREVALGGGIPLIVVVVAGGLILSISGKLPLRIPLSVIPILLLGLLDDIKPMSPLTKLVSQFAATGFYLILAPLSIKLLPVLALVMVIYQNAWNLIDIMDGLLGWISLIAFSGLGIICFLLGPGLTYTGYLCFIVSGSTAGFLFWNSYPARVFLGDSGSLALGMLFCTIGNECISFSPPIISSVFLLSEIPLFELCFLVIERSRHGVAFYRKSADHFALRMLEKGFTVKQIISKVRAVALSLLIISVILFLFRENHRAGWAIILICASGSVGFYRYLSSLPVRGRTVDKSVESYKT